MTFCQNCGANLEPGAPVCPRCGKSAAAQPYQPPQLIRYGTYPAPQPAGTNNFALLGFVMAWLPIPFAGLVLSIIALVQCGQTGQKGRGLAVAGIVARVIIDIALIAGIAVAFHSLRGSGLFEAFDYFGSYGWEGLEEYFAVIFRPAAPPPPPFAPA